VKRDKEAYAEEFMQQYRHYQLAMPRFGSKFVGMILARFQSFIASV
jgi:hypothetical protein